MKPAAKEPEVELVERLNVHLFNGVTYQELADEIEILTEVHTEDGESVVVGYAIYRRLEKLK